MCVFVCVCCAYFSISYFSCFLAKLACLLTGLLLLLKELVTFALAPFSSTCGVLAIFHIRKLEFLHSQLFLGSQNRSCNSTQEMWIERTGILQM